MANEFQTPLQNEEKRDASYTDATAQGSLTYDQRYAAMYGNDARPKTALSMKEEQGMKQSEEGFLSWVIKPLNMISASAAPVALFGHDYQSDDPMQMVSEGLDVMSQEFKNRLFRGDATEYGYRMAEKLMGKDANELSKHSVGMLAEIVLDPLSYVGGVGLYKLGQKVFRKSRVVKAAGAAGNQQNPKLFTQTVDELVDKAKVPEAERKALNAAAAAADAGDTKAIYLLAQKFSSPAMNTYYRKTKFNEVEELTKVYEDILGKFDNKELLRVKDGAVQDLNTWHLTGSEDASRYVEGLSGFRKQDFETPNIWGEGKREPTTLDKAAVQQLEVRMDKILGGKPMSRKYSTVNHLGMARIIWFADNMGKVVSRNLATYEAVGGDINRLKFMKSVLFHRTILDELTGRASEAGRTLRMLRTDAADAVRRAGQIAGSVAKVDDVNPILKMATRYARRLDGEQHSKFWSFFPGKLVDFARIADDSVYNWYINSMLYSWKTFAKNMVSNTLAVTLLPTERLLTGMIGSATRLDTGPFRLAWHETRAWLNGMSGGTNDMWRLIRRENIVDGAGETRRITATDMGYPEYLTKNAHEIAQTFRNDLGPELERAGWFGKAVHFIGHNWLIQRPGRALYSTDKFFKMALYRADVARIAATKTVTNRTPLLGKASQLYRHNIDNVDAQVMAEAADTAMYGTFSKPFQGRLRGLAQMANAPVVKYFTPFIRTNVNLLGFGLERTPMAVATPGFWRSMKQGGAQAQLAMAKVATGTAIGFTALNMFDSKDLTGYNAAPGSPEWRARKEMGIPDTSFRVLGAWVDYSNMEPIRAILAPVDIYKRMLDYADPQDVEVMKDLQDYASSYLATYGLMAGGEGFISGFASLVGLSDTIRRLNIADEETREDVLDRKLARGAGEFTSRMVPNILKDIAQYMDPRATITGDVTALGEMASKIMAKIPGLSEHLPGYKNFWGDEIVLPRGVSGLLDFNYLYDPSNKYSRYNAEMLRVGVNFKHFSRKAMSIRVTAAEYSAMQSYFGQIVSKSIPAMMKSPMWKRMPDALKKTEIEFVINKAKYISRRMMAGQRDAIGQGFRVRHQEFQVEEARRKFGVTL